MTVFYIKYECLNAQGKIIKAGKVKSKPMLSKFAAMAELDKWMQKQLPDFKKLNVIDIYEDTILGDMGNPFESFMDALGMNSKSKTP